jgi:hypothetical protein
MCTGGGCRCEDQVNGWEGESGTGGEQDVCRVCSCVAVAAVTGQSTACTASGSEAVVEASDGLRLIDSTGTRCAHVTCA